MSIERLNSAAKCSKGTSLERGLQVCQLQLKDSVLQQIDCAKGTSWVRGLKCHLLAIKRFNSAANWSKGKDGSLQLKDSSLQKKISKQTQSPSKLLKNAQNCSKMLKIAQNCSKMLKNAQKCSRFFEVI